ncbi:hypothetical protein AB6A40_003243 [Gnathostoma spinigerum]|uniref:Uncharacterized protein n=1 Tax=Gnathostoma spinigerum TaxID=75299 RepID=A0ABD6EGR7_9BILA
MSGDPMSQQTIQTYGSTEEPKRDVIEKFVYDENDPFYMAPAVCRLLHYRAAAMICGIVEVALLILAVLAVLALQLEKGVTGVWMTSTTILILIVATATTTLMVYGVLTEQARFLLPQLGFMHAEVVLLIAINVISILSMSMGVDTTHRLFGTFLSVHTIEDHFGPIWPFNIAILSFFAAAIVIWFYIVIRGAYDYLLDKEHFTRKPNIELVMKVDCN